MAYKAWESRRRLREYLVAKVGGSSVEKLLALLIESGAIYSAIWLVVVIFQVGEYKYFNTSDSISRKEYHFLYIFSLIMDV
ncbi:hypothetical protein GSI_11086 [Ganoderma sinense ZZ0214-1]|uniref:Uncharacterized protein n=1 Tax=Ganoderma sinense ZZ0214-1 TaxID=1077348 RepID=A0A2G8RZA0_9APHY|nr:hypothetical protein GSI_11086 [Ganoderma sinense ZZ0214-1]